jgi:membrane fusion protein, multidrug efflux system
MRPSFIACFVLSLLSCLSTSCGGSAASETAGGPSGGRGGGTPAVPVTVARVTKKAVPLEVRVIGGVEPSSSVAIRAQLTGELTSVQFTEGEDVKQGDVLFTLDRRPLEAALRQSEANLDRDVAQAANAASQAKRYEDLAARGIATREQVDTSAANATALQATVGADRAAVENARIQLNYATITAPVTGRTGALMVHPGNLVRANDTAPLVVINQVTPVNVVFAIPEAQLPELEKYLSQKTVKVEAQTPGDADKPSDGRITFVDNAVDQTTGTIKVKGSFPNTDRRLWPGQYVNVVVTLTVDRSALVVPQSAVQNGPQGPYVFVIKSDQTAELRSVAIARVTESETLLASGASEGETVVTDGQLRLVPGAHVSIKPDAARSAQ